MQETGFKIIPANCLLESISVTVSCRLYSNIKQSLGEQLYAEARLEQRESTQLLFEDSYRIVTCAASPSTWVQPELKTRCHNKTKKKFEFSL